MTRILVPTDFSENAYGALLYATRLFKNQKCQFYILNTFEVKTPVLTGRMDTSKGETLYKKLSAKSKEGLAETCHSITRDTEDFNHSFEGLSVSKDLTETMKKTIINKNIDLVVMGTKGASGLASVFMGSNTVKTIQRIHDCPVLVIPDNYVYEKPEQIAFPTDFKRFYLENDLKPLIDIADLHDSYIRIFHINEEERFNEIQEHNYGMLKKQLDDFEHSIHWVAKGKQKTRLIQEFIEQLSIDMLVMVNYKHSLSENITHEPVIRRIGFHPSVPFLVIPDAS